MLGPFRASSPSSVGLLWKMPWRMSKTRKMRQRLRLKAVDDVISAVQASGVQTHSLAAASELPTEAQMPPKDKYTTFSRKDVGYRKGVHKSPHFTKVTSRTNPEGF
ncbi:60s ribosomal protein l31 [Rhodotorula diobovata]|uniref:60s ribosomal protein l31 n=1 Tax=Rhodotorula diobovata TaxID=5288 RepID=A0A5C5G3D6_9BASI|nr:60s ribosomal protein l31 [Rhodotorula diobovata]